MLKLKSPISALPPSTFFISIISAIGGDGLGDGDADGLGLTLGLGLGDTPTLGEGDALTSSSLIVAVPVCLDTEALPVVTDTISAKKYSSVGVSGIKSDVIDTENEALP